MSQATVAYMIAGYWVLGMSWLAACLITGAIKRTGSDQNVGWDIAFIVIGGAVWPLIAYRLFAALFRGKEKFDIFP